jgi:hypothetical protein
MRLPIGVIFPKLVAARRCAGEGGHRTLAGELATRQFDGDMTLTPASVTEAEPSKEVTQGASPESVRE